MAHLLHAPFLVGQWLVHGCCDICAVCVTLCLINSRLLWVSKLLAAGAIVNLCLGGFVAAIRITSLLNMGMLRNTFVTSVCR